MTSSRIINEIMTDQDELRASGASRVLADNLDYLLDGISSTCLLSSQRQSAKDFLIFCINCTNTFTDVDRTIKTIISRLPIVCNLLSRSLPENDIGVRICLQSVLLLLWSLEKENFFLVFSTHIPIIFSCLLRSCLISPYDLSNNNDAKYNDLYGANIDRRKESISENKDTYSNYCRKRKFAKISNIEKKIIGSEIKLDSMKYDCTNSDISSNNINPSQHENNYRLQLHDFIAQIECIVNNQFPSLFGNLYSHSTSNVNNNNNNNNNSPPLYSSNYNPIDITCNILYNSSTSSSSLSIYHLGSALAANILSEIIQHSITYDNNIQKNQQKSKSNLDHQNNYRRKKSNTRNNKNKNPENESKKDGTRNIPTSTSLHQQCIQLLTESNKDDNTQDILSLLCQKTSTLILDLLPSITSTSIKDTSTSLPDPDILLTSTSYAVHHTISKDSNHHHCLWLLLWNYLSILEGVCYHQPTIQELLGKYWYYNSLSIDTNHHITPRSNDNDNDNNSNDNNSSYNSSKSNDNDNDNSRSYNSNNSNDNNISNNNSNKSNSDGNNRTMNDTTTSSSSSGILFPFIIVNLLEVLTPHFINDGNNIIMKSSVTSVIDPMCTHNTDNKEFILKSQPQLHQFDTYSSDYSSSAQSSVPINLSLSSSPSASKTANQSSEKSITSINTGNKEIANKFDVKTTLTVLDLWQATLKLLGSMTVLSSGMPQYITKMGSLAHQSLTCCQRWRKAVKASQLAASAAAAGVVVQKEGSECAREDTEVEATSGSLSTVSGYISSALSPHETDVDRMIFDCSLLLSSSLTNVLEKAMVTTTLDLSSSSLMEGMDAREYKRSIGGSSNSNSNSNSHDMRPDNFADSYDGNCSSKLATRSTATPTNTMTTTTLLYQRLEEQEDDNMNLNTNKNSSSYLYETTITDIPYTTVNHIGKLISSVFQSSTSWNALPGLIWDMLLDETEGFLHDLREGAQVEGMTSRNRDSSGSSLRQIRNYKVSQQDDIRRDCSERNSQEILQGSKGNDMTLPLSNISPSKDTSIMVRQRDTTKSETVHRIPVAELIMSAHYSLLLHALSGGSHSSRSHSHSHAGNASLSQTNITSIGTWGRVTPRSDVTDKSSCWSTAFPPSLATERKCRSVNTTRKSSSAVSSSWWLPLRVLKSFLTIQGLTGELVVDDLPAVLAAINDIDNTNDTNNSTSRDRNVRLLKSLRDLDNHNDSTEESPYSLSQSSSSSRSSKSSRSDRSTSKSSEEGNYISPPYRTALLVPSPLSGDMNANKMRKRRKLTPILNNYEDIYNSHNNNNNNGGRVYRQEVSQIHPIHSKASRTLATGAVVAGNHTGNHSHVLSAKQPNYQKLNQQSDRPWQQQQTNTKPLLIAADHRRDDDCMNRDNTINYLNDDDDDDEYVEVEQADSNHHRSQEEFLANNKLVDYSTHSQCTRNESTQKKEKDRDVSWKSRRKFTNKEGTFSNIVTSSFSNNIRETYSSSAVVCKADQISNREETLLFDNHTHRDCSGSTMPITSPPSSVFDFEDTCYL